MLSATVQSLLHFSSPFCHILCRRCGGQETLKLHLQTSAGYKGRHILPPTTGHLSLVSLPPPLSSCPANILTVPCLPCLSPAGTHTLVCLISETKPESLLIFLQLRLTFLILHEAKYLANVISKPHLCVESNLTPPPLHRNHIAVSSMFPFLVGLLLPPETPCVLASALPPPPVPGGCTCTHI